MNTPIKVVIQIPCLDEEATLPLTVADLPRELDGVDLIETLVIDDGSADGTVEVARKIGVDHIVRHTNRKDLARAFCTGIDACLKLGADIIVNTDADNQYAAGDISRLIKPILDGKADIVVGTRDTQNLPEFSFTKKKLQKLGSLVVRRFSGANVPDAVSGFRALSRDAALKMNIISPFSYTIQGLIQVGQVSRVGDRGGGHFILSVAVCRSWRRCRSRNRPLTCARSSRVRWGAQEHRRGDRLLRM